MHDKEKLGVAGPRAFIVTTGVLPVSLAARMGALETKLQWNNDIQYSQILVSII